jgi:hypothetical protein
MAGGHAVDHGLIGVADPAGVDGDDDVARTGRERGDVLERQVVLRFDEEGSAHADTLPRIGRSREPVAITLTS